MALCACLSVTSAAQETREKYEAQYQLEHDPVAKAKILAKLGHFEIEQAHSDLKADKDEQSLADLERYRDQVESVRPGPLHHWCECRAAPLRLQGAANQPSRKRFAALMN